MKHYLLLFMMSQSYLLFSQTQPGLHVAENHTVVFGQDTTSTGDKLLWYPSKAAFRAGRTPTTEWIQENVGGFSAAFGSGTEARGLYSSAFGLSTWAFSYAETSLGRYSLGGGNLFSWIGTDALFEVGNGGSSSSRSNALTVYKNGNADIQHSVSIGDHVGTTPTAGTIQYNSTSKDYEAWDDESQRWVSLTHPAEVIGSGSVTDIDGNEYQTVTVGGETWMRENLRVTRYSNGDAIPEVVLNSDWDALNSGAWCWYTNDPNLDMTYGKLYNWYAVNDARDICPTGWHIPSDSEWQTLFNLVQPTNLGRDHSTFGTFDIGGNWISTFLVHTNESGFSAQPAGIRSNGFSNLGIYWIFWSSNASSSFFYDSTDSAPAIFPAIIPLEYGASVRCIKD